MSFTVASYNILADSYINPAWYPGVSESMLDPHLRRPALYRHIAELDADFVCLQEVEADVFGELTEYLGPLGYRGENAPKGQRKPDGCAAFYKPAVFTLRSAQRVPYNDGTSAQLASGHVALFLLLERLGRSVGIATTHLKWEAANTPPEQRWGYRQMGMLLEERSRVAPDCATWILCGDFNATIDSPTLRRATQAGFLDAYRTCGFMDTCNSNQSAKRIDFLLHTPDLTAAPMPLPSITDTTPLPSKVAPSDHLPIVAEFDWVSEGN
jgi:mRNA deadenylase 3'-5' endonuclease subunit Ccr4